MRYTDTLAERGAGAGNGRLRPVRRRLGLLIAAGTAALFAAAPAAALEADYGVGYGTVLSNNVFLRPTDEQAEWINMFRGLFSLQDVSDRLDARFFSLLEYRQYTQTDLDDEVLLGIDSSVNWTLSPRRLTFTVEDRFTQAPITPDVAVNPFNRQDVNIFSAGPNLTLRLGRVNTAEFGGRYSNYYLEVSKNGSNRYSAYARLARQISPITRVSVNYEPSYIDYSNNAINPDYTRQDIFFNARTNRLGLDIGFDIGSTFIDRDNAAIRDVEGRLLRGTLTRQMTSDSSLTLSASDQYSDAGRDTLVVNPLLLGSQSPSAVSPTDFVGGGLYAIQAADIGYIKRRYYGNNILSAFWRQTDFENPQILLDHEIRGAYADFGIDYSAAMTTSFFGNISETNYLRVARTDRDTGIGARVIYRFLRTLSLSAEGRWSRRDSSASAFSYDELRAVLTIAYNTNYALTVGNPFLQRNNPLYR